MFFDLHFWVLAIGYPVLNGILCLISIWGFVSTRLTLPFVLIGISAGLSAMIGMLWLILRIQKSTPIEIISKPIAKVLFPIQAVGEYASMVFYLIGFALLVYELAKLHKKF